MSLLHSSGDRGPSPRPNHLPNHRPGHRLEQHPPRTVHRWHGRVTSTDSPVLLPLPELLASLDCGPDGLETAEAARRLQEAGPNVLSAGHRTGLLTPLARQLAHPLALLLW